MAGKFFIIMLMLVLDVVHFNRSVLVYPRRDPAKLCDEYYVKLRRMRPTIWVIFQRWLILLWSRILSLAIEL
jgi:hypothetical protein